MPQFVRNPTNDSDANSCKNLPKLVDVFETEFISKIWKKVAGVCFDVSGERLQAGKEDLAAAVDANVQYSSVQEDED